MIGIQTKRLIGEYTTQQAGALLIATGNIHGNEPAGTKALERVFYALNHLRPDFKGMFIGMRGNMSAYERQQRFITADLNRQWYKEKVHYVQNTPLYNLTKAEDKEQKELLQLLNSYEHKFRKSYPNETVFMLDLHTFSADNGKAYAITPENGLSKKFALKLGVPVIIGLENTLKGTTIQYFETQKMLTCCFEAGQHYDPRSIDKAEAAIWMMLYNLGCLTKAAIPNFTYHQTLLYGIGDALPSLVKFCYRHAVTPEDDFVMRPGYTNFQPIEKGEILAETRHGIVRSPYKGLMLMPLYQKKGSDGFFIVQEVKEKM